MPQDFYRDLTDIRNGCRDGLKELVYVLSRLPIALLIVLCVPLLALAMMRETRLLEKQQRDDMGVGR